MAAYQAKPYTISREDLCSSKVGFLYKRRVERAAYDLAHGVANASSIDHTLKNLKKMPKARREKIKLAGTTYEDLRSRAEQLYQAHATIEQKHKTVSQQRAADIADLTDKWQTNIEQNVEKGIIDYEFDRPTLESYYEKAKKLGAKDLVRRIDNTFAGLHVFTEHVRESNPAEYLSSKEWTPGAKFAALRIMKRTYTGDFGAMLQNLYRDQLTQAKAEVSATNDSTLIEHFNKLIKTDKQAIAYAPAPASIDAVVAAAPAVVETASAAAAPVAAKKPGLLSRIADYVGNKAKSIAHVAAVGGCYLLSSSSCGKNEQTRAPAANKMIAAKATNQEIAHPAAFMQPYVRQDGSKTESTTKTGSDVKEPKMETPFKLEGPIAEESKTDVPKTTVASTVGKAMGDTFKKEEPTVEKKDDSKTDAKLPDKRQDEHPYDRNTDRVPTMSDSDIALRAILRGEGYFSSDTSRFNATGKGILDFGNLGIDLYANAFIQKQDFDSVTVDGSGQRIFGGGHLYLPISQDLATFFEVDGGFENKDSTIDFASGSKFKFGNESPFVNLKIGMTETDFDADESFGVGDKSNKVLLQFTKHWGDATGDVDGEYDALRAQIEAQFRFTDDLSARVGVSYFNEDIGSVLEQKNWYAQAGVRWHLGDDEHKAYLEALLLYQDLHSEFMGQDSDDTKFGIQFGAGYRAIDDAVKVDLRLNAGYLNSRESDDEWYVAPSVTLWFGGKEKK